MMSWVGLVSDLRKPPKHVLESNLVRDNIDVGMLPQLEPSATAAAASAAPAAVLDPAE
jgi:hypothetical protein